MSAPIYKDAVGVLLRIAIPDGLDVGYTLVSDLFTPKGSHLSKTPDVSTTPGFAQYVTVSRDLHEVGTYRWNVTATYATGKRIPLDALVFRVWPQDREGV